MANKDYNFQYTPLTGRLPGNSFVKQTEQAINELAQIVNEGSAQVEVINNLVNQANDNAAEALTKATEALETSGRVYITLPNLDDADDYFDSQLYYFANSHSANLPVEDTGFLEVKTNNTKTAAEQVFIADTTGLMYMRHGVITSTEVGDETIYSVTWETWSSALASEDYVQGELENYLPLSGGTMTGIIVRNETLAKNSEDDSYLSLWGGTEESYGAMLGLRGKNYSSNAGSFLLNASDGVNQKGFLGKPDGTLTWDGKTVERVNASGTNYIRYESGLQICWENGTTAGGIHQYTFPVAFSATPSVSLTLTSAENSTGYFCKIADLSETGVKALTMTAHSTYTQLRTYYIAVGYWK